MAWESTEGELNRNSKLTDAKARVIKYGIVPAARVAAMMGVNVRTIQKIRNGKAWKHIEREQ